MKNIFAKQASSSKDKIVPLSKTQLIYSQDFNETEGHILKANSQFIDYLMNHDIEIEGEMNDDFIFTTDGSTFKLKGVNLPTTILVVDSLQRHAQINQHSSNQTNQGDAPQENLPTHIRLQTHNYLKIEPHQLEYHFIYDQLMKEGLTDELFQTNDFQQVVAKIGMTLNDLKIKYKISPIQFYQLSKFATIFSLSRQELQQLGINLQTQLFVPITIPAMLLIVRNLLPFLLENQRIHQWFTYEDVCSNVKIGHQKILILIAKMFDLQVNFSLDDSFKIPEATATNSWQNQQFSVKKYKIRLQSILQFILLEIAVAKNEYLVDEMDKTIQNMINIYLPIGFQEFAESAAQAALPSIIAKYFITINHQNFAKRVYYNPLLVESTVKGRIKFISKYKNRFSQSELKGVFDGMITKNAVDLSDITIKNFRKYGSDYEIKLVIPK